MIIRKLMKKGISPVVATALLIVVAVVSIVGFQSWYNTYQSGIISNVEMKSVSSSIISVEGIIGNKLYLKSPENEVLSLLKIIDSTTSETVCEFKGGAKEKENNLDSLVAWWKLDGDFHDSSGNGFDGICGFGECPLVVSGINNQAYKFELDKINFGEIFNIGLNNWTYSFWIRVNTTNRGYILTKGASAGYNGTRIEMGSMPAGVGRGFFGTQSGMWVAVNGNKYINDNKWHHIVLTYDRLANVTMYVDTEKGGSADISTHNNSNIVNNYNLYLGSSNPLTSFNGSIDEVKIWDRVLSSYEIEREYFFSLEEDLNLIKIIDISVCDLQKGEEYNIVGFTDSQKIEAKVIVK